MARKIHHGTEHEHDMVHEGHDRTHHPRKDGGHVEPHDLDGGRKHGGHTGHPKKRARGGNLEHHKDGRLPEHHAKRKHGGPVKGKDAPHRPDRPRHRARGGNDGGTADLSPETAAGKMSALPFERKQIPMEGGKGTALERRND
jgi:hypothetical protein